MTQEQLRYAYMMQQRRQALLRAYITNLNMMAQVQAAGNADDNKIDETYTKIIYLDGSHEYKKITGSISSGNL